MEAIGNNVFILGGIRTGSLVSGSVETCEGSVGRKQLRSSWFEKAREENRVANRPDSTTASHRRK
jgi:hypothetical protein